jgi:hypothetical protein
MRQFDSHNAEDLAATQVALDHQSGGVLHVLVDQAEVLAGCGRRRRETGSAGRQPWIISDSIMMPGSGHG